MQYRLLKEAALRELNEDHISPMGKVDIAISRCYRELDDICREVKDPDFLSYVKERIKERLIQNWNEDSHGFPRKSRLAGLPRGFGPDEYESEPAYIYGHG